MASPPGALPALHVAPAQQTMGHDGLSTDKFASLGRGVAALEAAAAAGSGPGATGGLLPPDALFDDPGGKYALRFPGAFPAVEVRVTHEDRLVAEGGAMLTASGEVDLYPSLQGGGVTAAMCRQCCLDESFFFTVFKARHPGAAADVLLAPTVPGEVAMLHVDEDHAWRIGRGGFFAADATVDLKVVRQTIAQGCCSGEGLFLIKAKGTGRLLVNAYGGLVMYRLQGGDEQVVENGQLVAWSANTPYKIVWASRRGWLASCATGQRLACKFEAPPDGTPGYVLASTHSVARLADELDKHLPKSAPESKGDGDGSD